MNCSKDLLASMRPNQNVAHTMRLRRKEYWVGIGRVGIDLFWVHEFGEVQLNKEIGIAAGAVIALKDVGHQRCDRVQVEGLVDASRVVACLQEPPLQEVIIVVKMNLLVALQDRDEEAVEQIAYVAVEDGQLGVVALCADVANLRFGWEIALESLDPEGIRTLLVGENKPAVEAGRPKMLFGRGATTFAEGAKRRRSLWHIRRGVSAA